MSSDPIRSFPVKYFTAIDIAKDLGVPEKQFRQWLRDQASYKANPFFVGLGHKAKQPWLFTQEDALITVFYWRLDHHQIDVAKTYQSLVRSR